MATVETASAPALSATRNKKSQSPSVLRRGATSEPRFDGASGLRFVVVSALRLFAPSPRLGVLTAFCFAGVAFGGIFVPPLAVVLPSAALEVGAAEAGAGAAVIPDAAGACAGGRVECAGASPAASSELPC